MMWDRVLKAFGLSMKGRAVSIRLSAAERRAQKWKRDSIQVVKQLALSINALEGRMKGFQRTVDTAKEEIDRYKAVVERDQKVLAKQLETANRIIDQHGDVEDSLSSELKILKEVVVPELMLANESIRAQMEADISLQAQRSATYAPTKDQEGV